MGGGKGVGGSLVTASPHKPAIKLQIEKAVDLVVRARVFLDAWHLSKGIDGRSKHQDFWDEYWEFWRFNEHALLFSHIVHMAALFENNSKTICFNRLRAELAKCPTKFDLAGIDKLLSGCSVTAKGVAILRNNAFAHRSSKMSYDEAFKQANLTADKLRELSDSALQIANAMLRLVGAAERDFATLPLQHLEKLASSLKQE